MQRQSAKLCSVDFLVPLLFIGTIVLGFLLVMTEASRSPTYLNYTTVTGFFLQDDPSTNATAFDYTAVNFGLINRTYSTDQKFDPHGKKTQWERFGHYVKHLNQEASDNVNYKVLFMGRHGEGWHNVAESFYGTPAWNCYWSEQEGNGTITWADAQLTDNGIAQAQKAHDFWAKEISEQNIPLPQKYYVSPLTRCLQTANITFKGLNLARDHPFVPEVKELFRESIGVHTCDRRGTKKYIHESFPTYTFEDGFAENDTLWNPITRETNSAQDARSKTVLDQVFSTDHSTWISVTSHSGEIGSILRVIGHQAFSLNTGAVIPVLIKAETIRGTAPATSTQPYTTVSTCTSPPATSTTASTTAPAASASTTAA